MRKTLSERILLFEQGEKIKKKRYEKEFEGFIKYSDDKRKLKVKAVKMWKNNFPPVYPHAKDDSDKLIKFLRETRGTLDWIMDNWHVYRPGKNHLKKSYKKMWMFAKPDFNKIMKHLSDSNKRKLEDNGLTDESLESKLLLVEFGHTEMLFAYEIYQYSNQLIKTHSNSPSILRKVGKQILNMRKSENQNASSKWMSAAIIIMGSILDALGIKSPLTEFLDFLALSTE